MTSERDNQDNQPEPGIEPNDELLALAQQYDQGARPMSRDEHLDAIDQHELARVQDALGILNAVKTDFDFLEQQTALDTPVGGETLNDKVTPKPSALPSQIGRFSIEGLLGQGGYAKVFLAYDPNLDRKVAVKVLKASQVFSSDSLARFEREAKAAAVLSHPNIIPVFETGTVESDQFIVSEYCPGINLEEWFKQQNNPAEPKVAATIVATVAEAVTHAHQRGILHRDLKLANLMLDQSELDSQSSMTADKFADRVRVTDFGLAKPMQGSDILETSEGAIVGTPAYMSPEQASGDQDITSSTDIYSLGVILYQLLTGKLPIVGKSHIDTLIAVKRDEPQPLRRLNPGVPLDLQAICLKCLNKKPAARYTSAFELAEDLRNWLQGIPVKARRVTSVEKLGKWCRRNPALTAALLAMTAGLIGTIFQWRNAVAQNERADRHVQMSQNVIDEMVNQVALDPNLPDELRLSMAERSVDLQELLLESEPDDRDVVRLTTRANTRLSHVLYDLGRYEDAILVLDRAAEIIGPFREEPELIVWATHVDSSRAGTLRMLGREEEASKEIDQMVQSADKNPNKLLVARAKFQQGMLKLQSAQYDAAIEELEQAAQIYRDNGNKYTGFEHAQTLLFIGNAALLSDDFELAETRTTEALDLLLELTNVYNIRKPAVLEAVGRCRIQLAQLTLADLRLMGLPVDPELPLLKQCRQQFADSVDALEECIEARPTNANPYALEVMAYEFWINMEVEQNSIDLGRTEAADLFELFLAIDKSIQHRPIAGYIAAESRLKIAKALIAREEVDEALVQLNLSRKLLDELLVDYPDVEKVQRFSNQCNDLLDQYSD